MKRKKKKKKLMKQNSGCISLSADKEEINIYATPDVRSINNGVTINQLGVPWKIFGYN